MSSVFPDLHTAARALGGKVAKDQVVCPGPGHSRVGASLSVRPNPDKPGGFEVFSHASDDWVECRNYVADKLGLDRWEAPEASGDILERMRLRALQSKGENNRADSGRASTNGSGERAKKSSGSGRVVAEYVYLDRDGSPHTKVLRKADPKDFIQLQWDGSQWIGGKRPGGKIPYRLPELLAAPDKSVFINEGEKDADNLARLEL
jgi:hypothetical protein